MKLGETRLVTLYNEVSKRTSFEGSVEEDYIESFMHMGKRFVSRPILGHSFMCGDSLGLALTLSPSQHLFLSSPAWYILPRLHSFVLSLTKQSKG